MDSLTASIYDPADLPDAFVKIYGGSKDSVQVFSAPARINITSTESKIAAITDFAKQIGKTRSEFMVEASLEYIRANA